jgi:hypothetical protein
MEEEEYNLGDTIFLICDNNKENVGIISAMSIDIASRGYRVCIYSIANIREEDYVRWSNWTCGYTADSKRSNMLLTEKIYPWLNRS